MYIEKLWDYISNVELYEDLSKHTKFIAGENKGVLNLRMQKEAEKIKLEELDNLINEKRKNVVCIDNAVNEINFLLKAFGFN